MGHYMTKEERIILQTLLDEKKPVSYIARKLGCCRQTVYNEIRRGQSDCQGQAAEDRQRPRLCCLHRA